MKSYADKQQDMLDVIEREVIATSRYLGKDKLDAKVIQAMADVPRHVFVPESERHFAYYDGPLQIGHGQTISQPYIVAIMTDLLDLNENHVVLEIGTGSGYQTAILSRLVKKVYSMEVIPQLSESASLVLQKLGYNNIEFIVGDGHEGYAEYAPYDAIMVTAAAGYIPDELVAQLKPSAKLIIPVGLPHSTQQLLLVNKLNNGETSTREVLAVSFVPLVNTHASLK